mmetsp:Transcript_84606/g.244561  ORF Transcript_84606/g.244561 Transcript_84606/m.244561 type:complete len:208 (-) Transcript_84606:161-784(-)
MGSGPVHKTNVNPSRTYYSSVVMTFAHLILFGLASDADKIDAVSVSRCVRKIVPQVCACCGHALTISQTSHVIPVYLSITEGRPSVRKRLLHKVFHGSSNGSSEKKLSSNTIIKLDWLFFVVQILQEFSSLPVSSIFCVVSVKVANSVRRVVVASPAKILHYRLLACSVCLLAHNSFLGHDGVLCVGRRTEKFIEQISGNRLGRGSD